MDPATIRSCFRAGIEPNFARFPFPPLLGQEGFGRPIPVRKEPLNASEDVEIQRRLLLPIGATIGAVACTSGTSPTGVGGDGGGGGSGGGGGDVAQCQELAANLATKCAGDDIRPCLWNAYKSLWSTGQTQLLIDSMNCLDATTCRTFSDPNEGEACLAKVHAAGESSAAKN